MRPVSRREWIHVIAASGVWLLTRRAVAAAQLPTQFFEPMRICDSTTKPTPAVPAPSAPSTATARERTSLLEPGLDGVTLVLTGQVVGLRCGPVKGARIDFWQADAKGHVDATGAHLRGYQKTADLGRYRLETIIPGAQPGRARMIWAKVQPPAGASLTTAMFFADDPAAANAPGYHPDLVLKTSASGAGKTATFDFILDL
jgi:protocatechuate 3,4-dioxygenase beta subunit